MAGYLEAYGLEDRRRERTVRWALLSVVIGIIVACVLYFSLRSYPAKRKVTQFMEDLRRHDYKAAYTLWGCTENSPCREYTFDKFLEDWGPKSAHPDAASAGIAQTRYCGPGVIVTVQFGKVGDNVPLWYERSNGTLGFAPWPVCAPQPKAYQ